MNLDPEDVAERITPKTKAIMPVHLFGRMAPARRARRARAADHRGRRAGVRRPRCGDRRRRSPRSASSRPRTCSGSATAAWSPRPTRRSADRVRLLRFHGSRDKVDFELVGYNSRLDEIQAAALRLFLPELDGLEPRPSRGGRALRRARSGGHLRAAGRRRPARLPHVRRPQPGARPARRGADRGRDLVRLVLRDADASPAGAALPRRRAGSLPETEQAVAREPRDPDVGRDRQPTCRSGSCRVMREAVAAKSAA